MSDNLTVKEALDSLYEALEAQKTTDVFRPVKTTEAALEERDPVNGFVYFVTDSKKIYLGTNDGYIPMGGNSGIYYGTKTLSDIDIAYPVFNLDDIDGDQMPIPGDMIVNVGSNILYNGFYRVTQTLSETSVLTTYLPVGGGSGGAGGGTGSAGGTAAIKFISPTSAKDSVLAGESYTITCELEAFDSNGDPVITSGTANWLINNQPVGVKDFTVYPGQLIEFEISNYLDSAKDTNNITLAISIDTGGTIPTTTRKIWNIKAIDLRLEWNPVYGETAFISEDTFTLAWIPYGGIDCTTHIIIDNDYQNGYFEKFIRSKDTGDTNRMTFNSLSYGSHQIEMYVSAKIGIDTYTTKSIVNELTFIKGGNTPFLTVPFYQTTATQYDTVEIPFVAYDPNSETAKVQFFVNGAEVSSDTYNRALNTIPYTIEHAGTVELSLKCGDDVKSFTLQVSELELDVEEAEGAKFKFKASSFSGNDEIRKWNQNGVTVSFSDNFDWENGGLKTEYDEKGHIRKYICVKNGTTMTINYNLFRSFAAQAGKLFKIIFKATKCYDYDARILTCYDANKKVGLILNAQNGTIYGGGETLTTQYCEDSYIELETEIWPDVADKDEDHPGDRFIMFWTDGIPSGIVAYTHGESDQGFNQTTPQAITIGSNDCDVFIYLIKVYESSLNENEHINNFIMDAPNTEEMLARFERNDIQDTQGRISWERLLEKNPNCPVHLYDIPRMTRNKKDKVSGCNYEQYKANNKAPVCKAEDIVIKVQGTSSAHYGVAAFNIDTDFSDKNTGYGKMTDSNGQLLRYYDADNRELEQYRGFWAMRPTSIPVDFTCTKVNVASCENANNALNQEWYNKHQPYHDAHRRKNEKARDCMEFTPGIVFIRDRNPNSTFGGVDENGNPVEVESAHDQNAYLNVFSDDSEYMKKVLSGNYNSVPYYQYAICNMGNSKDNVHVFHDTTNPKACCVEVTDNQDARHWMTVKIDKVDDAFHEFRYPDGNDKASDEMHQAWIDFVNWMASNDPSPRDENHPYGYTGELLDAPVTYGAYTFKGFDPPGYKGAPSPTGITLKGTTVFPFPELHQMDGTTEFIRFTHDTYEYRIMKMLHECEKHLVMDSVVYHFLFIERHTMVDNVAKNTFWSTEDLEHWDLTKNYDNDTADGNNNSGNLVYSYGLECLDKEKNGTKDIFNASDSVWFNFIFPLKEAQAALYTQLSSNNAWSASTYLNDFKRYQDIIPERCWVYDYFRKYIRPRRLGLDESTYLKRLEGGKKTHQRKQYETYHQFYMDSKHKTGQVSADYIDIRSNTGPLFNSSTVLPMSTYINCYAYAVIGGQEHHARIKRGEVHNIPVGQLVSNLNDATTYIHGPQMLQVLGNLQYVYPDYVKAAAADKLRSLTIGSDEAGYFNSNLDQASYATNTMLEYLAIQNSGISEGLGTLDLTNLKNLKELYINGSTFRGAYLPENGLMEHAKINGVSTLRAVNLEHLTDIAFDKEPIPEGTSDDTYISNIYRNLINITVANCPGIDTYDLVKNSNIQSYSLLDVDWTITDNNLTNGVMTNIDILDKLLAVSPKDDEGNPIGTAPMLTGKITIKQACSVDQYEIYKKYVKYYPNLEIIYDVSDLNPAVKITFLSDEDINSDIHYQVLGSGNSIENGGEKLGYLISESGPKNIAMEVPNKPDTQAYTFVFSHYWICDGISYYDEFATEPRREGSLPLNEVVPTKDMTFIPDFISEDRWYNVRFYNGSEIVLQEREDGQLVESWPVKYNNVYNGPIKNYAYREHPDAVKRYKFLGWALEPASRNPTFCDIENNYRIVNNINFYAHFEEENVYDSATDYQYFNISNGKIGVKPIYKNILKGKITIPLKAPDGSYLTEIADNGFANLTQVTHIYFQKGSSNFTTLGNYAFRRYANSGEVLFPAILSTVQLPEGIKKIGDYCFSQQVALTSLILPDTVEEIGQYAFAGESGVNMQISMSKLPKNLKILGSSAFWKAGPKFTITAIPSGVTKIPQGCFYDCQYILIQEFGIDSGDGGLETIEIGAFERAGIAITPDFNRVIFNKSVKNIALDDGIRRASFSNSYISKYVKTIEIHNDNLWNSYERVRDNGGHFADEKEDLTVELVEIN